MTRLEFLGLENVEEMKTILNKLVKGEEHYITYKDREGEQQKKLVCKNGRLYVGSNFSISLSVADNKKCYIGVDYLSSDDRIKLNNNKPTTQDVF